MLINRRTFSAGAAAALVFSPSLTQAEPIAPPPPVRKFTGHRFQRCMLDLARGKPLDQVECVLFDDESQLYAESSDWQGYLKMVWANREERERDIVVRAYLLKHNLFVRRPAHLRLPRSTLYSQHIEGGPRYLPGDAAWTYPLGNGLHQPFSFHWLHGGRIDTWCHGYPGNKLPSVTFAT